MFLRSSLEYQHALDSELDADVIAFCEEPVTLRYRLGQRLARHPVDAFVRTRHVCEFVEVKHEADASRPENAARWPSIAAAFNGFGYGYRVITERHLEKADRAATVEAIFERRNAPLPVGERLREILDALASAGRMTVGELETAFPGSIDLAVACAMARHGHLRLDLDVGFGRHMPAGIGPGLFRRIGLATRGVWK